MARIIDPWAFKNWQNLYDYCLAHGDDEAGARATADHMHSTARAEAILKARAVIEVIGSPPPPSVEVGLADELEAMSGGRSSTVERGNWLADNMPAVLAALRQQPLGVVEDGVPAAFVEAVRLREALTKIAADPRAVSPIREIARAALSSPTDTKGEA